MTPFDIRCPIGGLWTLLGLLLLAYGLMATAAGDRSLAVDRWWGAVMLVFGLLMLSGCWRGRGRQEGREQQKSVNGRRA